MKELLLFVMPRVRLFLCVFLASRALGGFRPVEGETQKANQENERQLRSLDDPSLMPSTPLSDLPSVGPTSKPTAGQKITATIGFKSSVSPSTVEALPQGVAILYRYIYIDAIVVEMDTALVSTLTQDDNVAYVEQDSLAYPTAETTPWGIPAIQASDATVPAPDPSSPCFKICVVDSGFSVGHEDLVSARPDRSLYLRSLHLTPADTGIRSHILSPLGTSLEKSLESRQDRRGTRLLTRMGLMLLGRSLPRVETTKVLSELSLPTKIFARS
jgi:hypothetical protein